MLECPKIGVSPLDLMHKKKYLTKSDILLDLALVRGLVSMQNKHYVWVLRQLLWLQIPDGKEKVTTVLHALEIYRQKPMKKPEMQTTATVPSHLRWTLRFIRHYLITQTA